MFQNSGDEFPDTGTFPPSQTCHPGQELLGDRHQVIADGGPEGGVEDSAMGGGGMRLDIL